MYTHTCCVSLGMRGGRCGMCMYMHMSYMSLCVRMHVHMCVEPRHVHVYAHVLCEPRHVHGHIWPLPPALFVACCCGWSAVHATPPHSSIAVNSAAAKLATCGLGTTPGSVAPFACLSGRRL